MLKWKKLGAVFSELGKSLKVFFISILVKMELVNKSIGKTRILKPNMPSFLFSKEHSKIW